MVNALKSDIKKPEKHWEININLQKISHSLIHTNTKIKSNSYRHQMKDVKTTDKLTAA
jgi:hypothetical protein